MSTNALATQVGGSHYKGMKIQHAEFCEVNYLSWCQASAIKYICRHKNKNGRQDVEKAIHYIQILIELAYVKHIGLLQIPNDAEVHWEIHPETFILENEIPAAEAQAIRFVVLHGFVANGKQALEEAIEILKKLLDEAYPVTPT